MFGNPPPIPLRQNIHASKDNVSGQTPIPPGPVARIMWQKAGIDIDQVYTLQVASQRKRISQAEVTKHNKQARELALRPLSAGENDLDILDGFEEPDLRQDASIYPPTEWYEKRRLSIPLPRIVPVLDTTADSEEVDLQQKQIYADALQTLTMGYTSKEDIAAVIEELGESSEGSTVEQNRDMLIRIFTVAFSNPEARCNAPFMIKDASERIVELAQAHVTSTEEVLPDTTIEITQTRSIYNTQGIQTGEEVLKTSIREQHV